jgi:hypothetical protein
MVCGRLGVFQQPVMNIGMICMYVYRHMLAFPHADCTAGVGRPGQAGLGYSTRPITLFLMNDFLSTYIFVRATRV